MKMEELLRRLAVLDDIEEIKKLQYRYINGLTTSNLDEVLGCFSEGGMVDTDMGVAKGAEERKSFFRKLLGEFHTGKEGPFLVHPIISVNGDRATGRWLLYIQFALPRKLAPRPAILTTEDAPDWMQGFCDAAYVREHGGWKIDYLKFRCRLTSPMPALKSAPR